MATTLTGTSAPTARARIERAIDELITLLDEIDADPDLEPFLGWPEDCSAALEGGTGHDDREEEDEHGGDVLDEPHDPMDEGNDEPDLGWGNPGGGDEIPADWQQPDDCFHSSAELSFDGSGSRQARRLLRDISPAPPRKRRRRPAPGRRA